MEQYEEIVNLIKIWFETVLNTAITSIEDFNNGKLYLEVLKKCDFINIPMDDTNLPSKRYEMLEETFDKFYNMKTNEMVDYETISYCKTTSYEDVISLCILLFGVCQSHTWSVVRLNDGHYQRLHILMKPVEMYLRQNTPVNRNVILSAITKASEKDLDDYSYEQKSSMTDTTNQFTDNHRQKAKRTTSDDEMENSLNIPSEASYPRFVTGNASCYSNSVNDSNSDMAAHNDSKDSLRHSRRNKGHLSFRKGLNQSHINSSYSRKYVNSPKLAEFRKQEAKRLKDLEADNKELKDLLNDYDLKIIEVESELERVNGYVDKLKLEKRNQSDETDELTVKMIDLQNTLAKKDNECERLTNKIVITKKEIHGKDDEIRQLNSINKELYSKIENLNNKIQTQDKGYDQIKLTEIEYAKNNQDLKNENVRLKRHIEENHAELENLRRGVKAPLRERCVSPDFNNVEEGESMNIISEFKFAEIQDEMGKEIEKYINETRTLSAEIAMKDKNSFELKLEMEALEKKYTSALSDYSSNLEDANIRIKDLEERHAERIVRQLPEMKPMGFKGIVDWLNETLMSVDLTIEERQIIVKSVARLLNVDQDHYNRSHQLCQEEIIKLDRNLLEMKQNIERKIREYDSLQNQLDDLGRHFQIISDELESEKNDNAQLTNYCQVQKVKFDEEQFKVKMILYNVQQEKTNLTGKYSDLKRDLVNCEYSLERSNEEINDLRDCYDKSLQALKKLSQDCQDYEEVIKEITESEQKIYRNSSCQTDKRDGFVSIGTNVMSPRASNMVDLNRVLRRNNPNSFYSPETVSQKLSPYATLSKNIISNKTLGSLRYTDNGQRNIHSPIETKHHRSPTTFHSRLYNGKSEIRSPLIHGNQNSRTYRQENVTRDNQLLITEKKTKARDSPLVKADRLNEIWKRNKEQPEHLKSSYPIETQGVEIGYAASVLFDSMKVCLDDNNFLGPTNDTARSSNSRRYTDINPMNFKSDQRQYQYNDNVMLDELLKRSNGTGILTARSLNTPRAESFKRPVVPQLNLRESRDTYNRGSDRENAQPMSSDRYLSDDDCNDGRSSVLSGSISFNVVNSPKAKNRGLPRGYIRKEMRK